MSQTEGDSPTRFDTFNISMLSQSKGENHFFILNICRKYQFDENSEEKCSFLNLETMSETELGGLLHKLNVYWKCQT